MRHNVKGALGTLIAVDRSELGLEVPLPRVLRRDLKVRGYVATLREVMRYRVFYFDAFVLESFGVRTSAP